MPYSHPCAKPKNKGERGATSPEETATEQKNRSPKGGYRAERERKVLGIKRAGKWMASGREGKRKPISFRLQNLSSLGLGK